MALPFSSLDTIRRIWLHPMLREVRRTDAEIRRLLEKAATAAESDILRLSKKGNVGSNIRRGQFTVARQEIRKTIRNLFSDIGEVVRDGRTGAVRAALLSAFGWEEPYYRKAGLSKPERDRLRAATQAVSRRNVDLMLRRFNTEQIPLSKQVYRSRQLASGWVDNTINVGIGRGLTARELADEVKSSIDPNVRGGVSYAAQRLARTELNNAFHTAAAVSSADKPWVQGMIWKLSGSHSRPDICDEYASEDRHDLGNGVFPRNKVPGKPHPHCFCFIVPDLLDEDAFVAKFANGDYDEHFDNMEKNGLPAPAAGPAPKPVAKPKPKPVVVAPKEGKAALAAAPKDLNDAALKVNGIPGIDSDRDEVVQYKGVKYAGTNTYLRTGSGSFFKDSVDAIDRSVDKSRLTDDVIVFRGVKDPRAVFGDLVDGDLTGMEWIDDAYLSTTADRRIADGFAEGGLVMRMRVGKGAPMLRLSGFAAADRKLDSTAPEAELLGGRGWKMRIVADRGRDENGMRQVEVEVISHARNGRDPWNES